ncbi:tumor necrosis factor b (TNF superfamily, member 2) isoform X2 [Cheilinus undulatus]|nr:tumor necrosis factor b (TNF superfamily, member 2) isoform X2 [Cheilinus undulatus]
MQSGKNEAQTKTDTSEKTDHHDSLRRIGSKAKAAIHLEGSYDEDGESNQLEWRNGQGQAFAQGGFKLENNKIVIPQSGLFFVYSQASFRVSCSDGDEERMGGVGPTPLSHRIWRYSDSIGSKVSLMSAVRSACQSTTQEDEYSSGQGWYNAVYLGAVFQLNKGDRLWTETNQLSELETDEGKTFFGVFAL